MKKFLHLIIDSNYVFNFIDKLNKYPSINSHEFVSIGKISDVRIIREYNISIYSRNRIKSLIDSLQYTDFSIHYLSIESTQILHEIKNEVIRVHWFYWGSDMYIPFKKFSYNLLENSTYNYYKEFGTFTSTQNRIINFLKKVKYGYLKNLSDENFQLCKRKNAIKRVDYFWHYNHFDYELLKELYSSKAKFNKFYYFETNYSQLKITDISGNRKINVQVGNSASITNNHFEVLNLLLRFREDPIQIFVPNVYGDMNLSRFLESSFKRMFNGCLEFIRDRLDISSYNNWLESIDIAIMNHRRTEAAGNIFVLLAMGKKVYMNSYSNLYLWLKEAGFIVYSIDQLATQEFGVFIEPLPFHHKLLNNNLINSYFNDESLSRIIQMINLED